MGLGRGLKGPHPLCQMALTSDSFYCIWRDNCHASLELFDCECPIFGDIAEF
jgi:hypothetical protein